MLTKNVSLQNMILARHSGTCLYNPTIQEIEAGGLGVYANLGYTVCLRPACVI